MCACTFILRLWTVEPSLFTMVKVIVLGYSVALLLPIFLCQETYDGDMLKEFIVRSKMLKTCSLQQSKFAAHNFTRTVTAILVTTI